MLVRLIVAAAIVTLAVALGVTQFKDGPDCFGTGLKVFVHDTGPFSQGGLFCSAGQWGIEVLLHRFFTASVSCRTKDPEKADLFLVPEQSLFLPLTPGHSVLSMKALHGWCPDVASSYNFLQFLAAAHSVDNIAPATLCHTLPHYVDNIALADN